MQFAFPVIDPEVTTGTDLAGYLNAWAPAVQSSHSGAARPTYAGEGLLWLDKSGGVTNWALKLFDGADDITVARINATANTVLYGDAVFNTVTSAGAVSAPLFTSAGVTAVNAVGAGNLQIGGVTKYKWDAAKFAPDNTLPNALDLASAGVPFRSAYFGTDLTVGGHFILTGNAGGLGGAQRYISGGGGAHFYFNVPTGASHLFAINEVPFAQVSAGGVSTPNLYASTAVYVAGANGNRGASIEVVKNSAYNAEAGGIYIATGLGTAGEMGLILSTDKANQVAVISSLVPGTGPAPMWLNPLGGKVCIGNPGFLNTQFAAVLSMRGGGNTLEFGHQNSAGYGSALGVENTSGQPGVFFCCELDSGNLYKTRGIAGTVVQGDLGGGLIIGTVPNANAGLQALVRQARFSGGTLSLQGSTQPALAFLPLSGSTRNTQIYQIGDQILFRDITNGLTKFTFDMTAGTFIAAGGIVGGLSGQIGAGTGQYTASGIAYSNATAVGNVGATTSDLMTYTLPANSFNSGAKGVRITAWGMGAGNGNFKSINFCWGSQIPVLTSFTLSNSPWRFSLVVMRSGVNTQRVNGIVYNNAGSLPQSANNLTQSDSAPIIIKITGGGGATNDVIQEGMLVEYLPG